MFDEYGDAKGKGAALLYVLVGLATLGYGTRAAIVGDGDGWIEWLLILGGPALIASGVMLYRRAIREERPTMAPESFRELLRTRAPSFWVCLDCRIVMPANATGHCRWCEEDSACIEVKNDDERRIALSELDERRDSPR